MRRVLCLLPLLTILLPLQVASAFEVGASFDLSNMDFARSQTVSQQGLPGDSYLWGVTATGRQQLSDQIVLDLQFTSDPILRNVGHTLLTYNDQFFSIRLGPFFGLLNAPSSILQSGLSTTVQIFVPGIVVLTLQSDNSLSGRLVMTGDYIQERSELAVGFFAENVIPTAYVRSKRYTWKTTSGEAIDAMTQYGLETDIFQKNIPYGVVLDFAYQDVSRSIVEDAGTTVNSYGALVVGTDLSIQLFDRLSLSADLESSVYMFGTNSLLGEVRADQFLFRLRTGVSYRF